jgi:hypothetical protein
MLQEAWCNKAATDLFESLVDAWWTNIDLTLELYILFLLLA